MDFSDPYVRPTLGKPARLPSGDWGASFETDEPVGALVTVTVVTSQGTTWTATYEIVRRDDQGQGLGARRG